MSLQSPQRRRWPVLAGRLAVGADAAQVADAIVSVWLEIDEALHPVIGRRGVAALYHRSLQLSAPRHPWLAVGHEGLLVAVDPSALKAAVLQQAPAQAVAAGDVLFESFHGLLASLVGASLTAQLLAGVRTDPSGCPPAKHTSS